MVFCQLDPKEHIAMTFYLKFQKFSFHSKKGAWKCRLQIWLQSCLGLNVLVNTSFNSTTSMLTICGEILKRRLLCQKSSPLAYKLMVSIPIAQNVLPKVNKLIKSSGIGFLNKKSVDVIIRVVHCAMQFSLSKCMIYRNIMRWVLDLVTKSKEDNA